MKNDKDHFDSQPQENQKYDQQGSEQVLIMAARKGLFRVILCFVLIVFCIYCIYDACVAHDFTDAGDERIGAVILLVLLYVFIRSIKLYVKREPLLIIDPKGFTDNSASLSPVGFVPWESVDDIYKGEEKGFITVTFQDESKITKKTKDSFVWLDIRPSSFSDDEVIEIMKKYHAQG